MSSFQLQRLRMLLESGMRNLNEVEGVLNPAAVWALMAHSTCSHDSSQKATIPASASPA